MGARYAVTFVLHSEVFLVPVNHAHIYAALNKQLLHEWIAVYCLLGWNDYILPDARIVLSNLPSDVSCLSPPFCSYCTGVLCFLLIYCLFAFSLLSGIFSKFPFCCPSCNYDKLAKSKCVLVQNDMLIHAWASWTVPTCILCSSSSTISSS